MSKRDYYEVIGVAKGATPEEIKKAFRRQARSLHPDNKDSGDEKAFKELAEAYEVLSDENKRASYDRYGHDGVKGSASRFDNFDFSGFQGFGMDDILESLFGASMRGGFGGARSGPAQGAHLRYDLELDFLEAVFGVEKKITVKRLDDCTTCLGTGAAVGANITTCQTCNGMGQVKELVNMLFVQSYQISTCPQCHGNGKSVDKPCRDCKGQGLTRKPKDWEFKVPAGIEDGSRIRIGQAGDKGPHGGPFGDLFVMVQVKRHKDFIRENNTIHVKQDVSFSMAALGGELLVPTVDGTKVLKIPHGVQTGTKLVMRDLGVPILNSPNRRGDQIVHINLKTPTKLSREEKELFERLAELQKEELHIDSSAKSESQEEKDVSETKNSSDSTSSGDNGHGSKKKSKSEKNKASKKDDTLLDKLVDVFRPKDEN
ncbi:MAG: molecular chaperone DnaJ [Cyanobacteria bacterium TGS_CYA1]|nr:molecular chaperone DnaJ [Cyanobacteria bacterium TGS_CYA1]